MKIVYSVCLFNRNKRTKLNNHIISTCEDFLIASLIWSKVSQSESIQLPESHISLLRILGTSKYITIKEICNHPDIIVSEPTIRRKLKEMELNCLIESKTVSQKLLYKGLQGISSIEISIEKQEFTLDVFKKTLNELIEKNRDGSFQDFKLIGSNLNLENEYTKVISDLSVYEKLKSIIDNDHKDTSNSDKTIVEGFQDNKKFLKRDEIDTEFIDMV